MHDPFWMSLLLYGHIAAGAMAFVVAPIALFSVKGVKTHRFWGKIYFMAMAVVAVTALTMALYRPVLFLALVAVFSFYTAFLGYRVLRMKALPFGKKVNTLDWMAAAVTFFSSLSLAFLAVVKPVTVQNMVIPGVVFGIIGMQIAGRAAWRFKHPPADKMFWWYGHMQGMIGSYIAAWSAFSVVTLSRFVGNQWYVWLWPTMMGVPAMWIWTIYYQRKFAPRQNQMASASR